ncbi:Glutathione S-transferase A [Hypsizygus marmoreus]|uniref:Glutathione S-transferase A n=1 Tax=Hypsizygus marmoreus TaxID=39966 RepID=A0A369JYH2_HYPMA|nr:Glutathione S-transferase A [Hypsizygus marmoreus]
MMSRDENLPNFSPILEEPHLPELFFINGSIPSWRVMMALHENELKYEATRLRVMSDRKETRLPGFLALNHRGKMSVFLDAIVPRQAEQHPSMDESAPEKVVINESLAILQYIEKYYNPSHPLLPLLPQWACRAQALARSQESENLRLAYDALENAHFDAEHRGGKLDPVEPRRMIAAVEHELDHWEVYAAKTEFIAEEVFGLADCAFFPMLAYIVHRGFEWRRQASPASSAQLDTGEV